VTNDLNLLVDVLSDAAAIEEPLGGSITTKSVLFKLFVLSIPINFSTDNSFFLGQDRVHDLLHITQDLECGLAPSS